jgi:hypothetical protein
MKLEHGEENDRTPALIRQTIGPDATADQARARAQGAAYIGAGLWPVLNLRSFAKVTGPKPEGWLVKAVGGLLVAIGASMVTGARAGERRSLAVLGAGSATALGTVALYYSAKRRIAPVYFADAIHHLGWAAAWGFVTARRALRPRRA